ncbi:MAG: hypothetical protein NW216_08315 [Hyphomicrobium sp.]|nr:hypothetical protein [Hyphomicrobium sp.]
MTGILVILTLIDIALAIFLVWVSGFILQGVNNTGPIMPEAIYFVGLLVSCVALPALAWLLRTRLEAGMTLLIAALPPILFAMLLSLSPT